MRNLKKLLAVIVALTLTLTFAIPAFAAGDLKADTKTCSDLGMLLGSGSGVTAEYGATAPLRYQAAILFLRLKGLEGAAKAWVGKDNFTDADKVGADNQAILSYLKDHPDLGWQGDGKNFNPLAEISAKEYYKILLTALGYVQDKDFKFDDTLTFAKDTAKLAMAGNVNPFTIDALAAATVEALKAPVKGGTDTLAVTMVAAGTLGADKAEAAGLYVSAPTCTLTATGAKILTVTFNKAVDTAKAVISVKKGNVAVNTDKIVFADDKKSAAITVTTKLSAGDYTVTVKGLTATDLTATVTAAAEKVAKIEITSAKVPRDADTLAGAKTATVYYKVKNQYGEDMSGEPITWSVSTGVAAANISTTDCHFQITAAGGADFIPGAIVYITGVHAASGTVINTQVEIAVAAKADAVAFKGVYDTTNSKLADLPAGFADNRWVLLFQVKDQYGNTMAAPTLSQLVFTSSNPAFVSSTITPAGITYSVDGTTYQAVKLAHGSTPDIGGDVTIQAISTITGKISTYAIKANALASLKTFTLSAPASMVAEGEKIEIPFSAADQYGNAITSFSSLDGKVTLTPASNGTTTGLYFEKQNDGSAKLKYIAPTDAGGNLYATDSADYPVYVTSLVANGGSFSSQMISVKELAKPVAIIGIDSDKATSIARSNSVSIKAENLIIQDQYGRTMSDSAVNTWIGGANSIVVTQDATTSTAFNVALNAGANAAKVVLTTTTDAAIISAAAVSAATEAITFTLAYTNNGDDPVATSAKVVTYTKVEKSTYTSYVADDLGTMYNNGLATTPTAIDYNKTVKVYGVLADGTKVQLPSADYSITTDGKLTVTDSVISDNATGGYSAAANDFKDSQGNAKNITVTVLITVNDLSTHAALQILEKTLTVSNAAPAVAAVAFTSDVANGAATINPTTGAAITLANLKSFVDTVKDQYGIAIGSTPTITITNLTKVDGSTFTVTGNGTNEANPGGGVSITGASMGDKFTATFKYGSVSVKVDFTVGKAV